LATQVMAPALVAQGRLVPLLEAFVERRNNPIDAVMLPDRQRLPKVLGCIEQVAAWFARAAA
jgi:hypothetical protein